MSRHQLSLVQMDEHRPLLQHDVQRALEGGNNDRSSVSEVPSAYRRTGSCSVYSLVIDSTPGKNAFISRSEFLTIGYEMYDLQLFCPTSCKILYKQFQSLLQGS